MKKEVSEAAWKSAFGAVPYIGSLLNEIVFDYRSRVKQNRLNEFVALLRDEFSKYNQEVIDFKKVEAEEFGDLFESVLKRVIQTNSTPKLKRFKDILVNHMTAECVTDYTETFLDLVSRLNETQISILSEHSKLEDLNVREELKRRKILETQISTTKNLLEKEKPLRAAGVANNSSKYENELIKTHQELARIKYKLDKNDNVRKPSTYKINEGEFHFLLQDLYSKGLLMDSVGTFDVKPFEYMYITEFGKRFLQFINE